MRWPCVDGEAGIGSVLRPGFLLPSLAFSRDELGGARVGCPVGGRSARRVAVRCRPKRARHDCRGVARRPGGPVRRREHLAGRGQGGRGKPAAPPPPRAATSPRDTAGRWRSRSPRVSRGRRGSSTPPELSVREPSVVCFAEDDRTSEPAPKPRFGSFAQPVVFDLQYSDVVEIPRIRNCVCTAVTDSNVPKVETCKVR